MDAPLETEKVPFGAKILHFLKTNSVAVVAFLAALVTSFIVPPDKDYLGYFDLKTLACLFSVLAVVCALRGIRFFVWLSYRIVLLCKDMRLSALALVYITFIGSMLIANDMALITFLPLGFMVLSVTGKEKYMARLFILQNIAANLGGMLTPFGNPQNLYLYSRFNIPDGQFFLIMLPSFLVSIVLFTLACLLFFRPEKLSLPDERIPVPKKRAIFYLVLFAVAIIMVFRILPFYIGFAVILIALLITDRPALKKVDYPLLITFVFFFIFAGNMGRIEPVRTFISGLLQRNTLLYSTLSCQFISNVPSAILLSQFTTNYPELLIGVNIGGTGTLIASLASLITYREYTRLNKGKGGRYILLFSAFNFSFLLLMQY